MVTTPPLNPLSANACHYQSITLTQHLSFLRLIARPIHDLYINALDLDHNDYCQYHKKPQKHLLVLIHLLLYINRDSPQDFYFKIY